MHDHDHIDFLNIVSHTELGAKGGDLTSMKSTALSPRAINVLMRTGHFNSLCYL